MYARDALDALHAEVDSALRAPAVSPPLDVARIAADLAETIPLCAAVVARDYAALRAPYAWKTDECRCGRPMCSPLKCTYSHRSPGVVADGCAIVLAALLDDPEAVVRVRARAHRGFATGMLSGVRAAVAAALVRGSRALAFLHALDSYSTEHALIATIEANNAGAVRGLSHAFPLAWRRVDWDDTWTTQWHEGRRKRTITRARRAVESVRSREMAKLLIELGLFGRDVVTHRFFEVTAYFSAPFTLELLAAGVDFSGSAALKYARTAELMSALLDAGVDPTTRVEFFGRPQTVACHLLSVWRVCYRGDRTAERARQILLLVPAEAWKRRAPAVVAWF